MKAKKKVGIIGGGDTRNEAPYDDNAWEFWGLNEISQERAERWFEMHPLAVNNEYELLWLRECKEPIYMLRTYESVPMSVCYPIERVLDMPGARDYFTCTFAYQVALAILEDFKEIGLWGMALGRGSPRERVVEKACLEWWLGLAEGKGIKITTSEDDGLLRSKWRYGYQYFYEKTGVEKQMKNLGLQIALRNNDFALMMRDVEADLVTGLYWKEEK